jgi:hypothetical protein
MKKVSQREMKRRLHERELFHERVRNVNGISLGTVNLVNHPELKSAIRTARLLDHTVVTQSFGTDLTFYAVKL